MDEKEIYSKIEKLNKLRQKELRNVIDREEEIERARKDIYVSLVLIYNYDQWITDLKYYNQVPSVNPTSTD